MRTTEGCSARKSEHLTNLPLSDKLVGKGEKSLLTTKRKRNMGYFIINTNDGTVVDLEGCVLVNDIDFDDKAKVIWEEWQVGGNDGDARELGEYAGKDLKRILGNCGFGDLNYGNTVAFSPDALREEFQAKLDAGMWDDDPYVQRALKFTDDEFSAFSSYILGNDYIWNVYNEEINSNLRPFIQEVLNETFEEAK